jgi:hypothetical protein
MILLPILYKLIASYVAIPEVGVDRLRHFYNAFLVMINTSGAKIADLLDCFMRDYPDPFPRRVVFCGGLVNLLKGDTITDVKIEYAKVQHVSKVFGC